MMERKGIIAAGNMLVDHVHQIVQWPERGWLAEITHSERSTGGAPLNVLLTLAKMHVGLPLQAVGLIGEDGDGDPAIEAAADRVIAQIADWTGTPDLADRIRVRRTISPSPASGRMIPLSTVVSSEWVTNPPALNRYQGYAAINIVGSPAPGHSSGEAMAIMERIVRDDLPAGFGYDWSGMSYQEILAGNTATLLLVLSIVVVFLCLAALYESWSIPVAVLMVVPLGLLGALVFSLMRGLPNDIFFKIGMITIIGLAAKNAILIVEFAVELRQAGKTLRDATIEAARLRFRPILMTSFAFIMGVVPMAISTGAGANSRHAIGTGVIGGMLFATILGLLMIPVFFVVVRRMLGDKMDEPSKEWLEKQEREGGTAMR